MFFINVQIMFIIIIIITISPTYLHVTEKHDLFVHDLKYPWLYVM